MGRQVGFAVGLGEPRCDFVNRKYNKVIYIWTNSHLQEPAEERYVVCPFLESCIEQRQRAFDARGITAVVLVLLESL